MTTAEAAAQLGLSEQHVRYLITNGHLQAQKYGRNWWVEPAAIEAYKGQPPSHKGWPAGKKRK